MGASPQPGNEAPANLAQLAVEQQVHELIFRLRDQTGYQHMNPGRCSVFADPHNSTNTPAHQLARIGYAAVPQLITALGDSRPSRATGRSPPHAPPLTVGDCAEQILESIAGRHFVENELTGHMSNSRQLAATTKAAEAWWAEFKVKGEKQMLIQGVTSPGQDTPAQAEMLCQRYPEVAVTTLICGVQATTNSNLRAWLVDDLARFDEPRVIEFLNREMSSAPFLEERVRAAYKLLGRQRLEVVQAIIREWKNPPKQEPPGEGSLELFLAGCGSVEAVQALGQDLRERSADMRFWVIRCIGGANSRDTNIFSPAAANAIEECLVTALDDTEEHAGLVDLGNLRHFYDLRICDMAGFLLAQRWPDRYVFGLSPSLSVRDRQRVECQNVWRRAHHLPALPLPPPPVHHVTPDQATVVTAIEWGDDGAKPSASFAASVEDFRGKPLDARKLVAFLDGFGAKPEPQASGLELKAVKDENLTGILLKIRLLPATAPADSQTWNIDKRVVLDGKTLQRGGGGEFVGQYSHAGSSLNFTESVATALAAEPETPFEIWFRLACRQ